MKVSGLTRGDTSRVFFSRCHSFISSWMYEIESLHDQHHSRWAREYSTRPRSRTSHSSCQSVPWCRTGLYQSLHSIPSRFVIHGFRSTIGCTSSSVEFARRYGQFDLIDLPSLALLIFHLCIEVLDVVFSHVKRGWVSVCLVFYWIVWWDEINED